MGLRFGPRRWGSGHGAGLRADGGAKCWGCGGRQLLGLRFPRRRLRDVRDRAADGARGRRRD
ncbi:UNVERIFIED_CONTAM: hypothetical protein Sradi_0459900 [Sesamum radiatum]|uniref:Uncharacterized protein n=1 Tax=Sesamum radiatum TaxID=300843 RepID=A0AAW2WBL2_SESRA